MNNIYFIGMCISFVVYLIIGYFVSKKVKDANDYYVAGRNAPTFLIAGSMIASYASTGLFMGDAGQCYSGGFAGLMLLSSMQVVGYILGAVFFGRYLRRSAVLTIPEYFGKRFDSERLRKLAAITAVITMVVYLLSVIQGVGTLMTVVTGVNYNLCITIALIVFTIVTITSGSRGVLITDTLMAALFTVTLVIAAGAVANSAGGWFPAVKELASQPDTADILSWRGREGVFGANVKVGFQSLLWGFIYGIVWMSVCMVGPWQSSRYLMARDENVVVRSAFISAPVIFLLQFLSGIAAAMVNVVNPALDEPSHVLIWAGMNLMPKLLGVLLLTGVLAAGISSATTFLSQIGASISNDFLGNKGDSIRIGRVSMFIASIIVLVAAIFNPPSIFWIMYLGGAIVASAWLPVAVASVLSDRVTKAGAFGGMLTGFLCCFLLRIISSVAGISLPVYLDPSLVGMVANALVLTVVSRFTKVSVGERQAKAALMVMPEKEKDIAALNKTLKYTKWSILIGIGMAAVLILFWIVPFYAGMAG